MAKKNITIRGKTVQVEDLDVTHPTGIPAKLVRATRGSETVEHTITFGANDGPRPQVDPAQLQKDLDTARQKAADEAAWRDEMKTALQQVS